MYVLGDPLNNDVLVVILSESHLVQVVEVVNLLVVNLQEGGLDAHLFAPPRRAVVPKQLPDGPLNDPVFFSRSRHGVRFTASRLPVGENGAVEPFLFSLGNGRENVRIEEFARRARWGKDGVKREINRSEWRNKRSMANDLRNNGLQGHACKTGAEGG